jgi:hypothetical protein
VIKNIIVSGCSFTQTPVGHKNWSVYLRDRIPEVDYVNYARSGGGNNYITDSMIKYLLQAQPDPQETLIMVMWTGVSRIDLNIGQEYYDLLGDWANKESVGPDRYVCSTGIGGAWPSLPRSLFEEIYKAMDYRALACNTLLQIVSLKNFLENHGYAYKFMSYVNYWQDLPDWYTPNLDFSITHYAGDNPLLKDLGDHWIWVNENKDCLYEFAKSHNMLLDDEFHPTQEAQKLFFEQVIQPHIKGYIE